MLIEMILKDGDYYSMTDLESPIPFKTISLGKLLGQKKKKGTVIFSYEFPEGTKFPKKRKKKVKPEAFKPEEDEDSETVKEENDKNADEDINEIQDVVPTRKYGVASPLQTRGRKIKQIDDKRVKEEAVIVGNKTFTSATIKCNSVLEKLKKKQPTQAAYAKKRCSICQREVTVPAWEVQFYSGHCNSYRCDKCCGG